MNGYAARSLCLLSARNLGDAVIHADFIKRLAAAGYAKRYLVWTFPQASFFFEGVGNCTVITSNFPMGATAGLFWRGGLFAFLRALFRVRGQAPSETLELLSDFRERWICRLIGAPVNLGPRWAAGHPFLRHIRRDPFASTVPAVPWDGSGIYATYERMLERLLPGLPYPASSALRPPRPHPPGRSPVIGIHPFASMPCKRWPEDHWSALLSFLRMAWPEAKIVLIGTPADLPTLERLRSSAGMDADTFTKSLPALSTRLASMDVLIGLDSFAVHLAHSAGLRTVVLVGPNEPRLFSPPDATVVSHPGLCEFQPCASKPRCEGTHFQYVCMNAISPKQVASAVDTALAR